MAGLLESKEGIRVSLSSKDTSPVKVGIAEPAKPDPGSVPGAVPTDPGDTPPKDASGNDDASVVSSEVYVGRGPSVPGAVDGAVPPKDASGVVEGVYAESL